jgi:formyltetrahydrofolate-dependent phosphoribosylglycinamide formyltransferase
MKGSKPVLNMAVFLSGGGTTLQNFIDKIESGELPARISVVVSSRADAYGLVRAKDHGIPTAVVPSSKFRRDWEAMSKAVTTAIEPYKVDLITLAGFMCFYRIPPEYTGRVMNIHPGLIPAFCGENLYGRFVHEAVIASGVKVSGCTVHFADNEYDSGPIIVQKTVPVLDDDTPETLAARVFEQECVAYPEAVRFFAEGRLRIEGQRVRILG